MFYTMVANTHIAVIYFKVVHPKTINKILWSSTGVNVFREHGLEIF